MKSRMVVVAIALSSIVLFAGSVLTANAAEPAAPQQKSITGEVTYFYPRNEPQMIAIQTDNATEHYFYLDEGYNVVHKKSLAEISVGDTVEIIFRENVKKEADGKDKTERKAATIRFIKQGAK